MYRGNNNRVLPVILVIIIIALVITAIVSAVQSMLGANKSSTAQQVDQTESALLNTAQTARVQYTVRGPIVADENFRSYQIVITPNSRSMTTYSGYLDQVLETVQLENNVKAYEEFVHALDKANFTKKRDLKENLDDTRGVCATGSVYEYDVMEGNQNIYHSWTSTCKGSKGTFMASNPQVGNLFLRQIPESNEYIKRAKVQ